MWCCGTSLGDGGDQCLYCEVRVVFGLCGVVEEALKMVVTSRPSSADIHSSTIL